MIIVALPTVPVAYLRVKAVVVENADGSGDRFISRRSVLRRLGIDHPEVVAQITQS